MYLQYHYQLCYKDLGSTAGLFSLFWEFDIFLGIRGFLWFFAGSLLAEACIEDCEFIRSTAFVIFFRMQCQFSAVFMALISPCISTNISYKFDPPKVETKPIDRKVRVAFYKSESWFQQNIGSRQCFTNGWPYTQHAN